MGNKTKSTEYIAEHEPCAVDDISGAGTSEDEEGSVDNTEDDQETAQLTEEGKDPLKPSESDKEPAEPAPEEGSTEKTPEDDKEPAKEENEHVQPVEERRVPSIAKRARTNPSSAKTGVIYLNHIPLGMDVDALRVMLRRVGKTGRIWLRPTNSSQRADAKPGEKPRRTSYVFKDGWVEFEARRDAKRAVALLNGQPMVGAKRRGRWADDLWAMRYLPRFTWEDLSREVFGNARERLLRVREEIAGARRERTWVESRAAMGKRIAHGRASGGRKVDVRSFRQKSVVEDEDDRRAREAADRVDRDVERGVKRKVDSDLVGMLFKKPKTDAS